MDSADPRPRSEFTAHSHMEDPAMHVRAVAADLEYFRRKRLIPRLLHFARRGTVPFTSLLQAYDPQDRPQPPAPPEGVERRIRNVEDRLDELIVAIAVTTLPMKTASTTIDDMRIERGDYDPFFRVAEQTYAGSMEDQIAQLEAALDECHVLIRTFTKALVQRGEVTPEALAQRHREVTTLGHRNGARIVARAWTDPAFKERLLSEGRDVVRELDIPPGRLGKLGVAENTSEVHHVVVCTLCSCYPHDVLGNPPWWYRTDEYKQRIIAEPRAMLADMFGLVIPEDQVVKVHDSTSDVRWMVLPQRPEGTEAMSEEELADLVTPESLVGVARANPRPADTATAGR